MKRLIILVCAVTSFMIAQDAAGQYKLSGVDVEYTYVSRYETVLTVTDAYGIGVTIPVSTIPEGAPFNVQTMRLTDVGLNAIGINLNVTLNEDGTGSISEGSNYPDINTITDADGNCVTLQQVLPVTDEFLYSSGQLGIAAPPVNTLGLPSISSQVGNTVGSLGLSGSLTFEDYPMIPSNPTLCDPTGTDCFPFTIGDADGSGTIEVYPNVNLLGIPEYVPGGAPLTGVTGGFFLDDQCNDAGGNCNSGPLSSIYAGNTEPDFYLEWHGVDGASSGLGWGDLEEVDEDGDGTWFDRQLGIPAITATYMNAACGFTQPIYGDVSDTFEAMGMGSCVDYVDVAYSAYLMDASLTQWGGFLTGNAATYSGTAAAVTDLATDPAGIMAGCGAYLAVNGTMPDDATCFSAAGAFYASGGAAPSDADVLACMAGGGDAADCITAGVTACVTDCATAGVVAYVTATNPGILANDSGHDFNGVDGRLTMNFDIPCVPIIEGRLVVAEFIAVGGCDDAADINSDGSYNVLDVVALVSCVLAADCDGGCTGDINSDGSYNVLDVVALVSCVLAADCADSGRVDNSASLNGAKSAEFKVIGNEVTMTADGNVVAVQMTLSHGNDFAITLTDNAYLAEYITEGNTTTLMIVNPDGSSLFTTNSDFAIESIEAASNSQTLMKTSVVSAKTFEISAASPNPFNPATQIQLNLNTDAMVSVKVFNTMGQLIDVIASGQMQNGAYSFTWDGSNAASGVYLVQTQVGAEIHNQKIMLIK